MEITFHFGAAGHPVSWSLYAVYGRACGVAVAAARTWYDRQIALRRTDTPPGGQFVVQIRDGIVVHSELLFDADYFRSHQEPDDPLWLCQFHTFPLEIPETVKDTVTEELRQRLIDVGFFIPRSEWEHRYPEQVAMALEFRAALDRQGASWRSDGKDPA